MGSKTTSPANVRGRARSAMSRAVPPIEWPKPMACSSPSASHDGEDVSREAVPVAQVRGGALGRPVAAVVDGPAVEAVGQGGGQGGEDVAVEPGGVGQQQRWSVAAEVVDGQAQAVGGGHEHPAMIVGRGWTRQDRPLA